MGDSSGPIAAATVAEGLEARYESINLESLQHPIHILNLFHSPKQLAALVER